MKPNAFDLTEEQTAEVERDVAAGLLSPDSFSATVAALYRARIDHLRGRSRLYVGAFNLALILVIRWRRLRWKYQRLASWMVRR